MAIDMEQGDSSIIIMQTMLAILKKIRCVDKESTITEVVISNFSKNRYTGEWKNDKRHGDGVLEYQVREKYVGHYEEGMKSG